MKWCFRNPFFQTFVMFKLCGEKTVIELYSQGQGSFINFFAWSLICIFLFEKTDGVGFLVLPSFIFLRRFRITWKSEFLQKMGIPFSYRKISFGNERFLGNEELFTLFTRKKVFSSSLKSSCLLLRWWGDYYQGTRLSKRTTSQKIFDVSWMTVK